MLMTLRLFAETEDRDGEWPIKTESTQWSFPSDMQPSASEVAFDLKPALDAVVKAVVQSGKSPQETEAAYVGRVHDYLLVLIRLGPQAAEARGAIIEQLKPGVALMRGLDATPAMTLHSDLLNIVAQTGAPVQTEQRDIVLKQALAGLSSGNPRYYASAARVAGILGMDAISAVPLLLRALATVPPAPGELINGVFRVQPSTLMETVRALGKIGKGAQSAVPRLTRIAGGQDELSGVLLNDARAALLAIQGG